jgi:putative ABC transport system permease protein
MMESMPPKFADKFLGLFCKGDLLEEIQGDLYEFYVRTKTSKGNFQANMAYWFHVLNFLRPFAFKKTQNSNYTIMIKYNFKIAFRNLSKHKFFAFLNISGLTIAIACCIFIGIFIKDELGYDKHFDNNENIYRVSSDLVFSGDKFHMALSPAPMAAAFKSDFPEIIESGRFRKSHGMLIKKGDYYLKQERVAFADASMLQIFNLKFIYGDPGNSLKKLNTVILSRTAAEKFFGYNDPVGQLLDISDEPSLLVDGVYEDIPENSHFHFDMMITMENRTHSKSKIWLGNNYVTYFLLEDATTGEQLADKFPSVIKKYFGPQIKEYIGTDFDDLLANGSRLNYYLTPLVDIHLHSNLRNELESNGSIQNVMTFSIIGLFILFIACINFMNLSTAKSATRAKEVGMRKVLGSHKKHLIGQFLSESIVLSIISFLFAILLVFLFLPQFNNMVDKTIVNPLFGRLQIWPYLLVGSLVIGILAGIYPAIYLSTYNTIKVLKGEMNKGLKSMAFRNILVVFQFTISLILIIGTFVIYQQLLFGQNKRLGYDKNNVLIIYDTYTLNNNFKAFKNELLSNSNIVNATGTYFLPTSNGRSDFPYMAADSDKIDESVSVQNWNVDENYIPTLGMNLLKGRNFDQARASDTIAVILNETAVKRFGFENPIGQVIKPASKDDSRANTRLRIIGVIEDFHYDSFRSEILPMALHFSQGTFSMALRYNSNDPLEMVGNLENIWQKHGAGHPFEYKFMDQEFNAKFKSEKNLGVTIGTFTSLAIFIATLGLFGLAAFTSQQRKKEIGIRKVLGASISSIVSLLLKNFTRLLVIALVIGIPISYYIMESWLESFAYRTTLNPWIFFLSAFLIIAIAWITVGYQSIKAATSNPTDNLNVE